MTNEKAYGRFYGIGVGPGDPELLTLRAARILKEVDVVFHVAGPRSRYSISEMIVASLEGCEGKSEELAFSMSKDPDVRQAAVDEAAARVCAVLEEGRDCAFATIGDPLIYSTFSYLKRSVAERLPDVPVTIVPGITAYQAAASQWGKPLAEDQDILTVLPGSPSDEKQLQAIRAADSVVCLKTYRDRETLLDTLRTELEAEEQLYAARVGQDDEILETDAKRIAALSEDYVSLLIARRRESND